MVFLALDTENWDAERKKVVQMHSTRPYFLDVISCMHFSLAIYVEKGSGQNACIKMLYPITSLHLKFQ